MIQTIRRAAMGALLALALPNQLLSSEPNTPGPMAPQGMEELKEFYSTFKSGLGFVAGVADAVVYLADKMEGVSDVTVRPFPTPDLHVELGLTVKIPYEVRFQYSEGIADFGNILAEFYVFLNDEVLHWEYYHLKKANYDFTARGSVYVGAKAWPCKNLTDSIRVVAFLHDLKFAAWGNSEEAQAGRTKRTAFGKNDMTIKMVGHWAKGERYSGWGEMPSSEASDSAGMSLTVVSPYYLQTTKTDNGATKEHGSQFQHSFDVVMQYHLNYPNFQVLDPEPPVANVVVDALDPKPEWDFQPPPPKVKFEPAGKGKYDKENIAQEGSHKGQKHHRYADDYGATVSGKNRVYKVKKKEQEGAGKKGKKKDEKKKEEQRPEKVPLEYDWSGEFRRAPRQTGCGRKYSVRDVVGVPTPGVPGQKDDRPSVPTEDRGGSGEGKPTPTPGRGDSSAPEERRDHSGHSPRRPVVPDDMRLPRGAPFAEVVVERGTTIEIMCSGTALVIPPGAQVDTAVVIEVEAGDELPADETAAVQFDDGTGFVTRLAESVLVGTVFTVGLANLLDGGSEDAGLPVHDGATTGFVGSERAFDHVSIASRQIDHLMVPNAVFRRPNGERVGQFGTVSGLDPRALATPRIRTLDAAGSVVEENEIPAAVDGTPTLAFDRAAYAAGQAGTLTIHVNEYWSVYDRTRFGGAQDFAQQPPQLISSPNLTGLPSQLALSEDPGPLRLPFTATGPGSAAAALLMPGAIPPAPRTRPEVDTYSEPSHTSYRSWRDGFREVPNPWRGSGHGGGQ